jgi:hypothetical protein
VRPVGASVAYVASKSRRLGGLLAQSGTSDAVDAIAAAEALLSAPSLVPTSDARDIMLLIEGQPEAADVRVIAI